MKLRNGRTKDDECPIEHERAAAENRGALGQSTPQSIDASPVLQTVSVPTSREQGMDAYDVTKLVEAQNNINANATMLKDKIMHTHTMIAAWIELQEKYKDAVAAAAMEKEANLLAQSRFDSMRVLCENERARSASKIKDARLQARHEVNRLLRIIKNMPSAEQILSDRLRYQAAEKELENKNCEIVLLSQQLNLLSQQLVYSQPAAGNVEYSLPGTIAFGTPSSITAFEAVASPTSVPVPATLDSQLPTSFSSQIQDVPIALKDRNDTTSVCDIDYCLEPASAGANVSIDSTEPDWLASCDDSWNGVLESVVFEPSGVKEQSPQRRQPLEMTNKPIKSRLNPLRAMGETKRKFRPLKRHIINSQIESEPFLLNLEEMIPMSSNG